MKHGNTKKPTKINFSPFDYTVHYLPAVDPINHGETSRDAKEIVIKNKGNPQSIQETVVHECLHVLLEDLISMARAHSGGSEEAEEATIRVLSPRLLQWIQNNPELMKYLQRKE